MALARRDGDDREFCDYVEVNIGSFIISSLLIIGIPVVLWSGLIRFVARLECPPRFAERRPEWQVALVALPLGFLACAGWLSWTAADKSGRAREPAIPAPNEFPKWQIIACGITLIAVACGVSHIARRLFAGSLASALGTSAGFALAMNVDVASMKVSSQEGVGVAISILFLTAGLMVATTILALCRAFFGLRTPRRG